MWQLACLLVAIAGCYRAPQPACGFVCGTNGACPDNYSCEADNRCHLAGVGSLCESAVDAGPDSPFVPTDGVFLDAPNLLQIDILAEYPGINAPGIQVNTPINVTFSVVLSAVDMSQASISSVEGGAILFNPGSNNQTIPLTPYLQLAGSTTYTVELGSQFTAPSGYVIQPFAWMFTTDLDRIPPNLVFAMPGNGGSVADDTTPIMLAFDEHVLNINTTSWVVSSGGTPIAGTVTEMLDDPYEFWIFRPIAPYPALSTIEYTLSSAITDAVGNALVPIDYTFTTP